MLDEAAYNEIEQLLLLNSVPGDFDAKSDQNKQETEQDDQPRVP